MTSKRDATILEPLTYPLLRQTVGRLIRQIWVDTVTGEKHLDTPGPCLLAANHQSYFDFLLLTSISRRKIRFLAAEKFFSDPLWLPIMKCVGSIKVDRYSHISMRSYKEIRKAISCDRLIGIFPEGTRSSDGRPLTPKTGVAKLAIKARLPVIPVGIIGTYDILPRDRRIPRFRRAQVRIGEPVVYYTPDSKVENKFTYMDISEDIMSRISRLIRENPA